MSSIVSIVRPIGGVDRKGVDIVRENVISVSETANAGATK